MILISFVLPLTLLTGRSVLGDSGVEIAPYTVLQSRSYQDKTIEIRRYDNIVVVSTSSQNGEDSAFGRLFQYISGKNDNKQDIAMTAPVFMDSARDSGQSTDTMSFVMPADFSKEMTPSPKNPDVYIETKDNWVVAAIQFNGSLNSKNIEAHDNILRQWIDDEGLDIVDKRKIAGYNPPWTIPAMRRNEILIPVDFGIN